MLSRNNPIVCPFVRRFWEITMTLISGRIERIVFGGHCKSRTGFKRRRVDAPANLTHSHTWNFAHLYFLQVRERRGQVKKANFRRKSTVKTRRFDDDRIKGSIPLRLRATLRCYVAIQTHLKLCSPNIKSTGRAKSQARL